MEPPAVYVRASKRETPGLTRRGVSCEHCGHRPHAVAQGRWRLVLSDYGGWGRAGYVCHRCWTRRIEPWIRRSGFSSWVFPPLDVLRRIDQELLPTLNLHDPIFEHVPLDDGDDTLTWDQHPGFLGMRAIFMPTAPVDI